MRYGSYFDGLGKVDTRGEGGREGGKEGRNGGRADVPGDRCVGLS